MITKVNLFLSCLLFSNCYAEDTYLVPAIVYDLDAEAEVDKIKNTVYDFVSPNVKIGDRLEHRKMCSKIEWLKEEFEGYKNVILYRCHLTGYDKLFVDVLNNSKKETMATEYGLFKIPDEIEQDILFDVSNETPTPISCSFKYKTQTEESGFVLHPYCFKLGYDSDYTESWNDVISSIVSNQPNP